MKSLQDILFEEAENAFEVETQNIYSLAKNGEETLKQILERLEPWEKDAYYAAKKHYEKLKEAKSRK